MKLTLNLQTFGKKNFRVAQYDDQTTVKKMVDSLLEVNYVPTLDNYIKLFSKEIVVVIHDDIVINGDSDNTLQQSNIVDGEYIYLLERSEYFKIGSMKLFIKPLDGNKFTLDNISCSQTIYSVAKLVSQRLMIPIESIRFIFAGNQLDFKKSVSNSSLQTESTLHLVLK
ncbi:ubiquitin [Heterostelium album PN500]|uniref:Ubiquitin n=1 Tax=Heterostelium pallidum (strain ATCC 26659 / Pp 5 / PN500) TaxID=670386 RepID=D3BFS4_HETP5|nr:ubiquitin [Heterostelium album PN500]EFA79684.1 ubiquitin [Heterostelium album PN500]|eukprot:XP_020431805.1 ubiquitin [Heterostelium album PN500]